MQGASILSPTFFPRIQTELPKAHQVALLRISLLLPKYGSEAEIAGAALCRQ